VDLENQVLELLQKNPKKDFTIIEIVTKVHGLKLSKNFHIDHYSEIWHVIGALNSLFKKGKVDMKLSSSRHALLYQIKEN
jgi:hypothetical protein